MDEENKNQTNEGNYKMNSTYQNDNFEENTSQREMFLTSFWKILWILFLNFLGIFLFFIPQTIILLVALSKEKENVSWLHSKYFSKVFSFFFGCAFLTWPPIVIIILIIAFTKPEEKSKKWIESNYLSKRICPVIGYYFLLTFLFMFLLLSFIFFSDL